MYKLALLSLAVIASLFWPVSNSNAQKIGSCQIFPSNNPWNQDVSQLPVHPQSATFIARISESRTNLHPDFGSNPAYGIPWIAVGANQPFVTITYNAYGDESDPGPFPIPPNAPVEGGSDMHVLVIDTAHCELYELFAATKDNGDNNWTAAGGAKFDLTSNAYRHNSWTSADAAGLPILPGLVRLDEVKAGAINHAVRFTAQRTQKGWIAPARHQAGSGDTTYPPMGLRLRLKANYDISNDTGEAKVILVALKKYGMLLADNGSSWFISGETNTSWNDDDLSQLKNVPGSAFEAVYTGPIETGNGNPEIVNTASQPNEFTFSPNPSFGTGHFAIEMPFAVSGAKLSLYDELGRISLLIFEGLLPAGRSEFQLSSSLASGSYRAVLTASGKIQTTLLQIVR